MRKPHQVLLGSVFITNVGTAAQTLALGKLLYDETGTIAAFGAVILFEYAVTVITNLIAGTITDRVDPLRSCRLTDTIRGSLVIAMSLAFALTEAVAWIFMISAVIQSTRPFYKSSFVRLQLNLVSNDERAAYNGQVSALFQGGQFVGIFMATMLFGSVGATAGITLNGLSFILSALLLSRLKVLVAATTSSTPPVSSIPRRPALIITHIWSDWWKTFRHLGRDLILVAFIVTSTLDLVAAAMLNLMLAPIAYGIFGPNPFWLGTLDGLFATGAVIAGLLSGRAAKVVNPVRSPFFCLIGQAALFFMLSVEPCGAAFLAAMFGFGVLNSLSWSHATTILHNRMDKTMRGRVTVLRYMAGAIIGAVAMSFLTPAENAGLGDGLRVAGLLALIGGVIPASGWWLFSLERNRIAGRMKEGT